MQAALIAYQMTRLMAKKGSEFKLSDFILKFDESDRSKDMTQQEILDHIRRQMSVIHRG